MFEDIEGLPQVDPEKLKELREQLTVALADRTTVDVEALAASLAGDDVPARVHTWLRENTVFHPYAGCLRGPRGTLWERAGNALDRCLLAAAMLKGNGYEVELVLGRISEAAAKAKVDGFMALPRPVLVEPPPPECGFSEAEQDALTALAARFGEAISAAQERVSSAYMDMIQRLQADVADGRILEAERRFLDWAAAARKALAINPELLLAGLVSLPAEAGNAFRTCAAEDQAKLDALFKPWLDRRELRMRRRDAPIIEKLARWAALQYSSLNQLLTQRWGGSLLHRILPAEGPRGVDVLGQILLYRKRQDTRRQLDEDTDTLVKAILDALERADLMPTDPLDTYAQAIRRSQDSAVLRYRLDGQAAWSLLDPEAPALGGDLPWPEADTVWTGAPEALPESWYHRVVFSVRVERRFKDERGYRFEDEISLNETLRSCEQVGVAIRFTIPPQPTGPEGMLSAALNARLTGAAVSRYVPTLAVGDRVVQGKPIEAVKEVSGIASALDEAGKFTDVIGDVTGIWLEAALLGPEGRTELPPRSMLDRYGLKRTELPNADGPRWLWRALPTVEPDALSMVGGVPEFMTRVLTAGVFCGARVPEREGLRLLQLVPPLHSNTGQSRPIDTDIVGMLRNWRRLVTSSASLDAATRETVDTQEQEAFQLRVDGLRRDLDATHQMVSWNQLLRYLLLSSNRYGSSKQIHCHPSILAVQMLSSDHRGPGVAFDIWWDALVTPCVDSREAWMHAFRASVHGSVLEHEILRGFPGLDRPESVAHTLLERIESGANLTATSGIERLHSVHEHQAVWFRVRERSVDPNLLVISCRDLSHSFWTVSVGDGLVTAIDASGLHQGYTEYVILIDVGLLGGAAMANCIAQALNDWSPERVPSCLLCALIVTVAAVALIAFVFDITLITMPIAMVAAIKKFLWAAIIGFSLKGSLDALAYLVMVWTTEPEYKGDLGDFDLVAFLGNFTDLIAFIQYYAKMCRYGVRV